MRNLFYFLWLEFQPLAILTLRLSNLKYVRVRCPLFVELRYLMSRQLLREQHVHNIRFSNTFEHFVICKILEPPNIY